MKRIVTAAVVPFLALAAGCATKGFVQEQTAPLADRLSGVEKRLSTIEAQVTDLAKRPVVSPADIDAAKNEAQQAAQSAQSSAGAASTAASRAETAASRAEAAASRAEGAAQQAEKAAGKSVKAFELQQKK
ncbi:alanine-zipper protein [Geobacter sp.]|uniref:alanine-zipper protein n=1 Tax=Geobacter sp. TaxID=46610 RepID=UPI0026380B82|nr:alanine-zipper protein [Geobacter sp.]